MGAFFKKRAPVFGLLSALLVLVASMTVLLQGQRMDAMPLSVGLSAPDFALIDTTGKPVRLNDLRGKAVVMLFTSSREAQSLAYDERFCKLANPHSNDSRVQFLAVHSRPGITADRTREIRVQAMNLGRNFPTLVDPSGLVAAQFAVTSRPAVVVIDPDGIIRYNGPFDDHVDPDQVTAQFCAQVLDEVLSENHLTLAQH